MIRLLLRSPVKTLIQSLLSSPHASYSTRPPTHRRRGAGDYYRRRKPPPPPPPLDPSKLGRLISTLPPRFSPEDLATALARQRDPRLCLGLFQWATWHPRFKHDPSAYLITVKKLGAAVMYADMDAVASQALAMAPLSEDLCNTIIYFYAEARMLSRAVGVYRRMRDSDDPHCRPTLRTYNLLFSALLTREGNSYINHMYMDNVRCLFRQMVEGGIEPDVVALNFMIKGYVLSLHLNDALRIFHQMGVVYRCSPNEHSYNYIVHGLCVQGRTANARELVEEMKGKGFVPGERAYNSLVSALALGGEVDEAVGVLLEMAGKGRRGDAVTYGTVVGEMCRRRRVEEAVRLLRELRERGMVDGGMHRELMEEIQEEYGG